MPYDYGRKRIAKALGLTGVEAEHIARKLKEAGVDEQAIDFEGAITDALDSADRYNSVKQHIHDYYGVDLDPPGAEELATYKEQELNELVSTKEGVKEALKKFYAKGGSQREKEAIRDRLLTNEPASDVLMVALYDGKDMPLAKRFLKEALGEPVPEIPPEIVNAPPAVQEKIVKERNKRLAFIDRFMTKVQNFNPEINIDFTKGRVSTVPGFVGRQIRETGSLFKQSAKALRADRKQARNPSIEQLQKRNMMLQQRMMPLQLQVEYQTLLHKREELEKLNRMYPSPQPPSATSILRSMFLMPDPQKEEQARRMREPLKREGYHVEQRTKLPVGYRWVKSPKRSQR